MGREISGDRGLTYPLFTEGRQVPASEIQNEFGTHPFVHNSRRVWSLPRSARLTPREFGASMSPTRADTACAIVPDETASVRASSLQSATGAEPGTYTYSPNPSLG